MTMASTGVQEQDPPPPTYGRHQEDLREAIFPIPCAGLCPNSTFNLFWYNERHPASISSLGDRNRDGEIPTKRTVAWENPSQRRFRRLRVTEPSSNVPIFSGNAKGMRRALHEKPMPCIRDY